MCGVWHPLKALSAKQVTPVELRPDGGSFEGHVSVRFLCQEADAVFFTTDGTNPVPFAADALAPMTGIYEPGSSTQRATAAVAGEFCSTILTSCIIKAVAATYEGGTSMSHPTSSMHAHTHTHTHTRAHTHIRICPVCRWMRKSGRMYVRVKRAASGVSQCKDNIGE